MSSYYPTTVLSHWLTVGQVFQRPYADLLTLRLQGAYWVLKGQLRVRTGDVTVKQSDKEIPELEGSETNKLSYLKRTPAREWRERAHENRFFWCLYSHVLRPTLGNKLWCLEQLENSKWGAKSSLRCTNSFRMKNTHVFILALKKTPLVPKTEKL